MKVIKYRAPGVIMFLSKGPFRPFADSMLDLPHCPGGPTEAVKPTELTNWLMDLRCEAMKAEQSIIVHWPLNREGIEPWFMPVGRFADTIILMED